MLIEGIKTIAHQMNCMVVAEGIEAANQRDMLRTMGIEYGQGYYFARPAPVDELILHLTSKAGNVWAETALEDVSNQTESAVS